MAGVRFGYETLNGVPIPEDGVSFGNISASGVTPYIRIRNAVFGGSYGYDTVTITFKGLENGLFSKPKPNSIGAQTFAFRGRNWRVIDVQEGAKFNIAGQTRFYTWSVTGVDMDTPVVKM